MELKLLDLCCRAGGTSRGYELAGFTPYGIDIDKQPHYPYPFAQEDAIAAMYLLEHIGITFSNGETLYLRDFVAFHASPPCEKWTKATKQWRLKGYEYPDLITPLRYLFQKTGKLYIIENVIDAPLENPLILNCAYFKLRVHRVRAFETNFHVDDPFLLPQNPRPIKMGRPVKEGDIIQPVGHFSGVDYAGKEMGIDWMVQGELSEAIPPVMTEYIGRFALKCLDVNVDVI